MSDGWLDIDLDNLHAEAARQPHLCKKVGDKLADLKMESDEAEIALELAKAEAAREIRLNPSKYDVLKVTEDSIKQAVPLMPAVQEAYREVIKTKHAVGVATASVSAVEQKKRMIEKEIDLFLSAYFASPSDGKRSSRDAAEGFRKGRERAEEEEAQKKLKKGLRRAKE